MSLDKNKIIIIVKGIEYDVTNFINIHPAGPQVFSNGKDCTLDMEYHSQRANNILKTLKIPGQLEKSSCSIM